MRKERLFAVSLAVLLLAGCASGPEPVKVDLSKPWLDPDRPVLKVGPTVLTRAEIYERIMSRFGTREILWGIAAEELFRLAAQRYGIEISPAEVEKKARSKYKAWAEAFPDRDSMTEELRLRGLTEEDMLKTFREEARNELLVARVVARMRRIDEEALRRYYRTTYAQNRVLVRRLAFPVRGKEEKESVLGFAEEARRRLLAGDSWDDVVRDFMTPVSKGAFPRAVGGDRWWIGDQEEHPEELKRVVFSLETGGVSEPVWEEEFGYHVFQVEEKIPSEPFEACVEKLRNELRAKEPDPEETRAAMAELESRWPVEISASTPDGAGS